MNHYLSAMSAVVLQHGGTIDKYIGDCIMAFWNAPLADPDHALHACEAALALRAELPGVYQSLHAQGLLGPEQSVQIGIGIHTGWVAVGNFGSLQRFDYTVLGDSVNQAARMESLCKTYERDILASRSVRDRVPQIAMESLGETRMRGKQELVEVFALN
jgi:adenylate cyclase